MDERRDRAPDAGSGRAPLAALGQLSPLQQAWSSYVTHTTACDHCRDVDRGRCEVSERLWQAYRVQDAAAYRGISGDT